MFRLDDLRGFEKGFLFAVFFIAKLPSAYSVGRICIYGMKKINGKILEKTPLSGVTSSTADPGKED